MQPLASSGTRRVRLSKETVDVTIASATLRTSATAWMISPCVSRCSAGSASKPCGRYHRALGLASASILCQRPTQKADIDYDCVRGFPQVLVAHTDGSRVLGGDHRRCQCGRPRVRVLERPHHAIHQGLCVCICPRAARAHTLCAVLPAVSATRRLYARNHVQSTGHRCVGFCGRQDARHGLQSELLCCQRLAARGVRCREFPRRGLGKPLRGPGWRSQDHWFADRV